LRLTRCCKEQFDDDLGAIFAEAYAYQQVRIDDSRIRISTCPAETELSMPLITAFDSGGT